MDPATEPAAAPPAEPPAEPAPPVVQVPPSVKGGAGPVHSCQADHAELYAQLRELEERVKGAAEDDDPPPIAPPAELPPAPSHRPAPSWLVAAAVVAVLVAGLVWVIRRRPLDLAGWKGAV